MGDVYLDLRAKTSEIAIKAAMVEFGVDDTEQLSVEVIQEPEIGFLGRVTSPGVYRITKKKPKRSGTGRGRGKGGTGGGRKKSDQPALRERTGRRSAKKGADQSERTLERKKPKPPGRSERPMSDDRPTISIDEQAAIAKDFLEGLVDAYGLEGEVTTSVDGEVIVGDVSGEQTEALVGVRGSVRSAIHELTRTVLQRYAQDTARLRLDIAGYGERRRQALAIYGEQLMEQLLTEGGEIMLEPMSPADRKVIHDVAAAHEGVTSYSEGEPPRRYVVLSAVAGDEEE